MNRIHWSFAAAGLCLAMKAAHQVGIDLGVTTPPLGDPGATALAGVAASGAFELAKSLVTDLCKTWAKTSPEDPGKLFANGHLTQLIGEAIHGVLVRELDHSEGSYRVQLDKLLPSVVAYWKKCWPDLTAGPLSAVHAGQLTAVLHHQIQDQEDFQLATPEAWAGFLRGLDEAHGAGLEDELCLRAAGRLHREVARAIYEKAKKAVQSNPAAWAALQLQFQSWILQGVAELQGTVRAEFAGQARQLAQIHDQLLALMADVPEIKATTGETLGVVTRIASDQERDSGVLRAAYQGIQTLVDRTPAGVASPARRTDEDLLRAFSSALSSMAIACEDYQQPGIDLGGAARLEEPLKLVAVYVALETATPRQRQAQASEDKVQDGHLSALEALFAPSHTRVVLTGKPGSGKSTFFQFVTLYLAKRLSGRAEERKRAGDADVPPLLQDQRLVPLRVILRDLAADRACEGKGGSDTVLRYLTGSFTDGSHHAAAIDLPELLRRGLALVLFDGLDEVPQIRLNAVREAIEAFATGDFKACRVAVTCRTASYDKPDFRLHQFPEPHTIAPLSDPLRAMFVGRLYQELGRCQPAFRGQERTCADSLLRAFAGQWLDEMSRNPFFLSAMVAQHRPEKPLPHTDALLMDTLVKGVLEESRKPQSANQGDGTQLADLLRDIPDGLAKLRTRLEMVAFLARERRQGKKGLTVDPDLLTARLVLSKALPARWVDDLLEVLRQRAGLLQSIDGQEFGFAYRFEEFLAGCHLTNDDQWKDQPNFAPRAADLLARQFDYARQTVLWAAGVNAWVRRRQGPVRELVSRLAREVRPGDQDALDRLILASDIARDTGMENWEDDDVPDTAATISRLRYYLEQVRDHLKIPGGPDGFSGKTRAQAASAIGRLGDLRPGVMPRAPFTKENPLFAWSEELSPATAFSMGEDEGQFPCTQIKGCYRLARYPVTVTQYALFVAAGGYGDPANPDEPPPWWARQNGRGNAGWSWISARQVAGPENFRPEFQTPNHPRVGVSWHEATAYCRWLCATYTAEQLGLPAGWGVRLPTESEWERAASDGGQRTFPWGDQTDFPERCNCQETRLGQTSAVGLFATGKAACGAEDMAGIVWEWCATKWKRSYQRDNQLSAEELEGSDGDDYRVLRGGSWGLVADLVRASSRYSVGPWYRDGVVGFRVAASPISGI